MNSNFVGFDAILLGNDFWCVFRTKRSMNEKKEIKPRFKFSNFDLHPASETIVLRDSLLSLRMPLMSTLGVVSSSSSLFGVFSQRSTPNISSEFLSRNILRICDSSRPTTHVLTEVRTRTETGTRPRSPCGRKER